MQKFHNHVNLKRPSVSQPVIGRNDMSQNRGGGYGFNLTDNQILQRFLVTGCGQGTYKAGSSTDITNSVGALKTLIIKNGNAFVDEVVKFSVEGRGPSNDPALYALSLASTSNDVDVRKKALDPHLFSQVVRTGTHLFTFLNYVQSMRGWGKALRKAVSRWYEDKSPSALSYQILKYRQRNGWTHRDVLRKSHPKVENGPKNDLLKYIAQGHRSHEITRAAELTNPKVALFEQLQSASKASEIVSTISNQPDKSIAWEFLPTHFLSDPEVWEALLPNINIGALIRNLGRLTSLGLVGGGSSNEKLITDKLLNRDALLRARIHPFNLLNALAVYRTGQGYRGSLTWNTNSNVKDAIEEAMYLCFQSVQPTNKRIMIGLDVSGSMDMHKISDGSDLSCREAAVLLTMVTAFVEQNCSIYGFSNTLIPLSINPTQTLFTNIATVNSLEFGHTNPGLLIEKALSENIPVDAFIIYTDNESNHGHHPSVLLKQYRQRTGINSKFITVGMTGHLSATVADPKDPGMLDIVGFDTATPKVISSFIGN